MPAPTADPDVVNTRAASDDAASRLEERLPPLLSIIAGMVDLTSFFTLGNIFTAHITGNLVLVAATPIRGGPFNPTQVLAIPVFIVALAATWLLARALGRRGRDLARPLLVSQFLLLALTLLFCVVTKPSASPHGLMAGIAAMIAVCAMACQYAIFRLAMPGAISTAVMTGNLANTVLSLMNALSRREPLMTVDGGQLKRSFSLLLGFMVGCALAATAVCLLGDWAWSLPVALASVAIALR